MKTAVWFAFHLPVASFAGPSSSPGKCKDVKTFYKNMKCCGNPEMDTGHQILPIKRKGNIFAQSANACDGKKQYLANVKCFKDNLEAVVEQAGADVTKDLQGTFDSKVTPQTDPYWKAGLCPVNVHWHIGAEHRSKGEYDEMFDDKGPEDSGTEERRGLRCNHYDAQDEKFTKPYNWKYCSNMAVGETYEIHWPHSVLGACGTSDQYQTPFYDGVFCNFEAMPSPQGLAHAVGVQGQVFTVVNDETYYYPDLIRGMIKEGTYGVDITYYTGSTTGTTRNNGVCSQYAPITWQVDRTCHLISASSFDKLCADMRAQKDSMLDDVHPHGAREVVWSNLSSDNKVHRRLRDGFQIDAMVYEV